MTIGGRPEFYDGFYLRGGWQYDAHEETAFLRDVLMPACQWQPGDRVIEIGAGRCFHAHLLRDLGMDVTAVEVSPEGIEGARRDFPGLDAVCADAATYSPDRPGHVYARGLSWYHYELGGVNSRGVDVPGCTAAVFEWMPPGAVFAMQIVTDLTGRRHEERVHQNQVSDYLGLFTRFGDTRVVDWSGKPIVPGQLHDRGVLVVTRKGS